MVAMPEGGISVTSHKSPVTSHQSLSPPCLPLPSCYNKARETLIQYHHLKGESARKGLSFV